MMLSSKKYFFGTVALGMLAFVGMFFVQQGFAWTNPTSSPPFSTNTINVSGGNVGIGTPASAYKLDVNGSTNLGGTIIGPSLGSMITVSGGGDGWYGMGQSTVAGGATPVNGYYPYAINMHTGLALTAHSAYGGIRFYNQPYPTSPMTSTPAMQIINNNIGIGMAGNPAYKLDVNGSINGTQVCIAGICQSSWPSSSVTWAAVTNKAVDDTARNDSSLDIGTSQYMRWKHYGNGHVIIDASNSTAPSGAAINNTDSQVAWSATYPTLMGWNGANTYGVRVDSARIADNALNKVAQTGDNMTGNLAFLNIGQGITGTYDPTKTQAVWSMGPAYVLPAGGGTTNYGSLYGLGWSYEPDYGGAGNNPQSKTGLSHQLLLMHNGVTKTAIGNGIWTSGNLNFGAANPTISASSYITVPGGAYFNSGSVYTEASIKARGGIYDDTHSNLSILGGTSGNTAFSGAICLGGTCKSSWDADRLEGKHWVTLYNSSVVLNNNQSTYIPLRTGALHRYYRHSVSSSHASVNVVHSYVPNADARASSYIERGSFSNPDYLVISNRSAYSGVTFYYSVDVWE